MNIIKVPLPPGRSYYDDSNLSEHDLKYLPKGTDLLFYYYGNGGYEGHGKAFFRCNGVWYYADLGHCSCYGPGEGFDVATPIDNFTQWYKDATPEFRAEVDPLMNAMQANDELL